MIAFAFRTLKFRRISASTDCRNQASIALLERLRFWREERVSGSYHEHANDEWCDELSTSSMRPGAHCLIIRLCDKRVCGPPNEGTFDEAVQHEPIQLRVQVPHCDLRQGAKVEIVPIPGNDSKSPEYLKINPLGKVPTLDADGVCSRVETINEYWKTSSRPPLMPKTPEGRAKVRTLTRFHDLYLEPPLRSLFGQINPKTRDEKVVNEKLTELNGRLDQLDKMLAEDGFAIGSEFTLADCAVAPSVFFCVNMLGAFGAKPPLEGRPKVAAWWSHVQTRPSVKKVLGEMGEALAALSRGR